LLGVIDEELVEVARVGPREAKFARAEERALGELGGA
jgi:hypothetical protein